MVCDSDDGSADESALHSADGGYLKQLHLYTVTPNGEEICSVSSIVKLYKRGRHAFLPLRRRRVATRGPGVRCESRSTYRYITVHTYVPYLQR